MNLKLTSHGILFYEQSADLLINLLMLFSTDYVNIYFFPISYFNRLKSVGLPHIAHVVIH